MKGSQLFPHLHPPAFPQTHSTLLYRSWTGQAGSPPAALVTPLRARALLLLVKNTAPGHYGRLWLRNTTPLSAAPSGRRQLALGFPVLVSSEFKLQIRANEYTLVCLAELCMRRRRGFLHVFYGTVWVGRWEREGVSALHVHVHVFMLSARVCMRMCISILCLIGSLFLQRRRKRKSACNESIYFMELPRRGAGEHNLCKKNRQLLLGGGHQSGFDFRS